MNLHFEQLLGTGTIRMKNIFSKLKLEITYKIDMMQRDNIVNINMVKIVIIGAALSPKVTWLTIHFHSLYFALFAL